MDAPLGERLAEPRAGLQRHLVPVADHRVHGEEDPRGAGRHHALHDHRHRGDHRAGGGGHHAEPVADGSIRVPGRPDLAEPVDDLVLRSQVENRLELARVRAIGRVLPDRAASRGQDRVGAESIEGRLEGGDQVGGERGGAKCVGRRSARGPSALAVAAGQRRRRCLTDGTQAGEVDGVQECVGGDRPRLGHIEAAIRQLSELPGLASHRPLARGRGADREDQRSAWALRTHPRPRRRA